MASRGLNDKQEQFCQEIAKGLTQRQAYKAAYPNSQKWSDRAVDVRASNLANDSKVLLRLKGLREQNAKNSEISRNDLLEQLRLIGFAKIDLDNIKVADKIKALEAMAKMLGYDAPEHTPIDGVLLKVKELLGVVDSGF